MTREMVRAMQRRSFQRHPACDSLREMAGLQLDDIDLDADVAVVLGKGRRPRFCPFRARTATALDRYLRLRRRLQGPNTKAL